ncbi:hypothetical protein [Caulobacter sp. 17J65-9]|uniref:hypothetical protein n=1 Tax=Caulobacter sp. 17J65-9 TaxID=2709382 RepID=UPI0013CD5CB8|nr:hypothetical protein [Caulobacter sp. 17J65-9]NEX94018.1 hypothetical protein [Caulobacter sp. 17J65-9]
MLSMFNAVLSWRVYSRWRRVRHKGTGALPLNHALLNAIENNQQTLSSNEGLFSRDPRRSWIVLRLLLSGEHHALNDAVLTRRIHTLRLTTVLVFALFFAPFALPHLQAG